MNSNILRQIGQLRQLMMIGCLGCFCCFLSSCSETDDEDSEEFGNWQYRNEIYFASLEDSLSRGGSQWQKIKSYTKVESAAGDNSEYIYVKKLKNGEGASPLYTDSVRISYRGRLIPSASYAQGYVFDETFVGDFNWETTSAKNSLASGFLEGFTTALLHMRKGDHWRVYIPCQLGYGESSQNALIPNYSTLIFDVILLDITMPGVPFPAWSVRQR